MKEKRGNVRLKKFISDQSPTGLTLPLTSGLWVGEEVEGELDLEKQGGFRGQEKRWHYRKTELCEYL